MTVLASRREEQRLVGREPGLIEIVAGPLAVHHQKAAFGLANEEGVMPDIAGIVHALAAAGQEGTVAFLDVGVAADDDEPRPVLQGIEDLAPQRVTLHDGNGDGLGPGVRHHDADVDGAALGGRLDMGQIVEALGEALVDGEVPRIVQFDDIAEGSERRLGEGCRLRELHVGFPSFTPLVAACILFASAYINNLASSGRNA